MAKYNVQPKDEEIHFSPDEIIVSKTDLKGRLTYANDVFCRVAEVESVDVIGEPHSVIRHPDMPRVIFKLLWEAIESGNEIFAYVKNMSFTGKYYWVIAHVTPTFDEQKNIIGYHSNRRNATKRALAEVIPLYKELRAIEAKHANAKDGLAASHARFKEILAASGKNYDEYVWGIGA